AETDQLHRHLQLANDAHDDSALGGAVELGQADAGETDRLVKHPGLGEAVLPGRRVEDHECLVRSAGKLAFDDAPNLGELVHQVRLRVQAARRIDDKDV